MKNLIKTLFFVIIITFNNVSAQKQHGTLKSEHKKLASSLSEAKLLHIELVRVLRDQDASKIWGPGIAWEPIADAWNVSDAAKAHNHFVQTKDATISLLTDGTKVGLKKSEFGSDDYLSCISPDQKSWSWCEKRSAVGNGVGAEWSVVTKMPDGSLGQEFVSLYCFNGIKVSNGSNQITQVVKETTPAGDVIVNVTINNSNTQSQTQTQDQVVQPSLATGTPVGQQVVYYPQQQLVPMMPMQQWGGGGVFAPSLSVNLGSWNFGGGNRGMGCVIPQPNNPQPHQPNVVVFNPHVPPVPGGQPGNTGGPIIGSPGNVGGGVIGNPGNTGGPIGNPGNTGGGFGNLAIREAASGILATPEETSATQEMWVAEQ